MTSSSATLPPIAALQAVEACGRCGYAGPHVDVEIHNGESIRRDCGTCNRFISFPKWKGIDASLQSTRP